MRAGNVHIRSLDDAPPASGTKAFSPTFTEWLTTFQKTPSEWLPPECYRIGYISGYPLKNSTETERGNCWSFKIKLLNIRLEILRSAVDLEILYPGESIFCIRFEACSAAGVLQQREALERKWLNVSSSSFSISQQVERSLKNSIRILIKVRILCGNVN